MFKVFNKDIVLNRWPRHKDSASEIAKDIERLTRYSPIVISEVFGQRSVKK